MAQNPSYPPSLNNFMTDGLCTFDTCNVCLESFDSAPVAVGFNGTNVCNHIFGRECLQEWLLSSSANANKCPTCRRDLCRAEDVAQAEEDTAGQEEEDEDEEDEESEDEQFPDDLQAISNPAHVYDFMVHLAARLKDAVREDSSSEEDEEDNSVGKDEEFENEGEDLEEEE
ncbi:hypothetical protein BU25DRAFT_453285 [Macroventuria anomochaeta]|uniref:Uncharacterized protein n=1 Tax=Macroventuria anomochaeta TaxID=301207 RepID=A0ACB6SJA9_9PLEO|nr:uncharacterized protein BU25DRAFT_453285 [Macroventuria anomochaeta]KAF2633534.1 hypothetical protein BU25DRAFT_453285 [Macroventuria anomochaeta]